MINLLVGPPRAGKSYEAVAYHIIPALSAGRMVITNMPLNVDAIASVFPEAQYLLKFVGDDEEAGTRGFAQIGAYGNEWRHAKSGMGPLYVIDECHKYLPRMGTPVSILEWFAEHGHEAADVLLITQSYGKVAKDIIDQLQVVYRVKKAVAFGTSKKYIRKVVDGVRGDTMNTSVRTYDAKFFPYYRTHTRGGGDEADANDIKAIWKRWPFVGAALFLVAGIALAVSRAGDMVPKVKAPAASPVEVAPAFRDPLEHPAAPVKQKEETIEIQPARKAALDGPLAGLGLHVLGSIWNESRHVYLLAVTQNGQLLKTMTQTELEKLGYEVEPVAELFLRVTFDGQSQWVTPDAPLAGRVGVGSGVSEQHSAPVKTAHAEPVRTIPYSGRPGMLLD